MTPFQWCVLWSIFHWLSVILSVSDAIPEHSIKSAPCSECKLDDGRSATPSIRSTIKNSRDYCPTRCHCPPESQNGQKPECPPGVSLLRDGCNCCWICARQSGESCSVRYTCDPLDGLDCLYAPLGYDEMIDSSKPSTDQTEPSTGMKRQPHVNWITNPPYAGATGICWKRQGRPCLVNGTWLSHTSVRIDQCQYRCTCVDGSLVCTDQCMDQEHNRPPEGICASFNEESPPMQLQLMPPGPGECCRRWMCVPTLGDSHTEDSRLTDEDLNAGTAELNQTSYYQSGTVSVPEQLIDSRIRHGEDFCHWEVRHSSPWTPCSQQCGLGLSWRWTTETVDCRNVTQTRLCFWRPCRSFLTQKNKIFTPTLKFARPGYLKFTTLHADPANASNFAWSKLNQTFSDSGTYSTHNSSQTKNSTIEPIVCQLERAFQPRFCNSPPNNSCCWPIRSKTKRLRFHCTGGRIVYHFFEWIHACQCKALRCESILGTGIYNQNSKTIQNRDW